MVASYAQPVSKRRRAIAVGLTLAVHVLLAWLLLNLAPDRWERLTSDALATFDVAPDRGPAAAPAQREQRQQQRQQRAASAAAPPPRPVPPPEPEVPLPEFLKMSRADFAATDIARTARKAAPGEATADTPGNARADSSSSYGPGAGPGGARLYNAEWVREPTPAELNPFLPQTAPGSWGEVACRTIPNNRVENCQLIGESPLGSRLATGIRRAAWQFQVRPPRVGGSPQVGEWVRIRIDITESGAALRR